MIETISDGHHCDDDLCTLRNGSQEQLLLGHMRHLTVTHGTQVEPNENWGVSTFFYRISILHSFENRKKQQQHKTY